MSILHAQITSVPIGHLEIEGLLFDEVVNNSLFGVAVPQIGNKFLPDEPQKYTAQSLKRLLSKDSENHITFIECRTPFTRGKTLAVSLTDFERLTAKLDRAGNIYAQEFRDALVGLSLTQLFHDAFDLKFEKQERQDYLRERQVHRESFHPLLTKWLKSDAGGDSGLVNWGREVNRFKQASGLPLTPVDSWDSLNLSALNRAEASYDSLRRAGLTHSRAVEILSER